jgi:hypothetical protein
MRDMATAQEKKVKEVAHKPNYWLMKSEPSCYSIDNLRSDRVGIWDDVRNYQLYA